MEGQAALAEIRRLTALLPPEYSPGKGGRSRYVEACLDRMSTLATQADLPTSAFPGAFRKPNLQGIEWGRWEPVQGSGFCSVQGTACFMDFLPKLSTGKEAALRWNGAYVAFGPGHRETLVLHRQLVQDAFGISLPAWVHVHHKHGAHDNRISSLEFLDRARHGDEHGRVGGRRGGVGVSKRERNALPKEREPGLLGGKRLRLRQDRREKRRQREAASQPQSPAMRMLGLLSIGSINIILP